VEINRDRKTMARSSAELLVHFVRPHKVKPLSADFVHLLFKHFKHREPEPVFLEMFMLCSGQHGYIKLNHSWS
jgi:hypothetical protein